MATKGISIEERLKVIEERLVAASDKQKQKLLKRKATLLVLLEKESGTKAMEPEPVIEKVVEPEPIVEEVIPAKLLAEELVSVLPASEPASETIPETIPELKPLELDNFPVEPVAEPIDEDFGPQGKRKRRKK